MNPAPTAIDPSRRRAGERGASAAEFLAVAPLLLLLGLGAVQLGLIYHGKTILNYATFEAARTGAVHHAQPGPMRRELAVRLAPLIGGDGSDADAAAAIARSIAAMEAPLAAGDGRPPPPTSVRVVSPTAEMFEDWSVVDPVSERRVIPNSHLRHRLNNHLRHRPTGAIGARSGVDLADANLLEIEVEHGLELKVPFVGGLLAAALTLADPDNAAWYEAGRMPLRSSATVRMQSDVWMADAAPSGTAAPDGDAAEGRADDVVADLGAPGPDVEGEIGEEGEAADPSCGEHGVGGGTVPVNDSDYASGECAVGAGGGDRVGLPPVLGGEPADEPDSSPLC